MPSIDCAGKYITYGNSIESNYHDIMAGFELCSYSNM